MVPELKHLIGCEGRVVQAPVAHVVAGAAGVPARQPDVSLRILLLQVAAYAGPITEQKIALLKHTTAEQGGWW